MRLKKSQDKTCLSSAIGLIGNTPLVKLPKSMIEVDAEVFVKLEEYNIGGSIKTRVAYNMINSAEKAGILKPFTGQVIAEPTGGNTGIGLAIVGNIRGYKVILVVPDNFSIEKQRILRLYGAEVYLSDSTTGNDSHIRKMSDILTKKPDVIFLNQFNNPANPNTHYNQTGPELLAALEKIDAFVSGVGSGGTITGVGKRLKESNSATKICAVQPKGCDILRGKSVPHKIQAIALGTLPPVFDPNIVDLVEDVTYDDVLDLLRRLATKTGLFLGLSSGANILAACRLANRMRSGSQIVTVAPDSGRSYLDQLEKGRLS